MLKIMKMQLFWSYRDNGILINEMEKIILKNRYHKHNSGYVLRVSS